MGVVWFGVCVGVVFGVEVEVDVGKGVCVGFIVGLVDDVGEGVMVDLSE